MQRIMLLYLLSADIISKLREMDYKTIMDFDVDISLINFEIDFVANAVQNAVQMQYCIPHPLASIEGNNDIAQDGYGIGV